MGRMSASDKDGFVDARRIYSTEGLRRIGIGGASLVRARANGLKCYTFHKTLFYEGKDIIEFLKGSYRDKTTGKGLPESDLCCVGTNGFFHAAGLTR